MTGDALRDVAGIQLFRGRDQRQRPEHAARGKRRISHVASAGIANSLPEGFTQQSDDRISRSGWRTDYKLAPNEIALVLGTAIQYDVAEVVDPLVHVVARIDKKALEARSRRSNLKYAVTGLEFLADALPAPTSSSGFGWKIAADISQ